MANINRLKEQLEAIDDMGHEELKLFVEAEEAEVKRLLEEKAYQALEQRIDKLAANTTVALTDGNAVAKVLAEHVTKMQDAVVKAVAAIVVESRESVSKAIKALGDRQAQPQQVTVSLDAVAKALELQAASLARIQVRAGDVNIPKAERPVVHVHMPKVKKAVQLVQRNKNDDIVSTTTEYEYEQ